MLKRQQQSMGKTSDHEADSCSMGIKHMLAIQRLARFYCVKQILMSLCSIPQRSQVSPFKRSLANGLPSRSIRILLSMIPRRRLLRNAQPGRTIPSVLLVELASSCAPQCHHTPSVGLSRFQSIPPISWRTTHHILLSTDKIISNMSAEQRSSHTLNLVSAKASNSV